MSDQKETVVLVKLDGKEYVQGSPAHVAALESQVEAARAAEKARADEAEKARDTALAERDAARAELAEARKAISPERIDALVAESLKLRADAAKLLPKEYAFDGKSALQIRTDAVAAKRGADWVTDKSEVYVTASFDMLVADSDKEPAKYVGSVPQGDANKNDSAGFSESLAEKARKQFGQEGSR